MAVENITCCSVTLQTASRAFRAETEHHTKVSQPRVYQRRTEPGIFVLVTLQGIAPKSQKINMHFNKLAHRQYSFNLVVTFIGITGAFRVEMLGRARYHTVVLDTVICSNFRIYMSPQILLWLQETLGFATV